MDETVEKRENGNVFRECKSHIEPRQNNNRSVMVHVQEGHLTLFLPKYEKHRVQQVDQLHN